MKLNFMKKKRVNNQKTKQKQKKGGKGIKTGTVTRPSVTHQIQTNQNISERNEYRQQLKRDGKPNKSSNHQMNHHEDRRSHSHQCNHRRQNEQVNQRKPIVSRINLFV